jgi:CheY-like chemotaxis protein
MPADTYPPPLRVLVVEDNHDAADTLRILLQLWGHEVQVAYTGQAALDMAPTFCPQVAILDIQMPRMHGGEVARRLRLVPGLENVFIIATTANDEADERLASFRPLFDYYLQKPYNPGKLECFLAECVGATGG